ncbi:MAG: hypothetical protein HGA47_09925 [Zoogloea sp.]|nr:hypothetical protein [Zoogloea sp.]
MDRLLRDLASRSGTTLEKARAAVEDLKRAGLVAEAADGRITLPLARPSGAQSGPEGGVR